MQVRISSRNADVTPELEEAVNDKIGRLDRYLEGLDHADVHFYEEKNPRIADKEVCEVSLEGHGHHVRCKVSAPDGLIAVDLAVEKLEKQLRKLKTKLVNRNHGGTKHSAAGLRDAADAVGPEPEIVKTKQFHKASMTPDEAILQSEILGHDFFVFENSQTGHSAVLYKRDDGDYGLIEQAD